MQREQQKSAGLERLTAALAASKGPAPVDRWNPPYCGDLDIRIAADGTWSYLGSPIGRAPLVKLFSSVLKREGDRHFLVTPVEKIGIQVEDAPFQAVQMEVDGAGEERAVHFRTNVDDVVTVGPEHRLRFERTAGDGAAPYVHVRSGLWARVTRALAYDLIALGEYRPEPGGLRFGVAAGGLFHGAPWLESGGDV